MKVNIQSQSFGHINPQEINNSNGNQIQNLDFNINQNDFSSILKNTEVAAKQTAFESLMDRLTKQEKIIFKNPSVANINVYKSIVRDILNVAANNFTVSEMELYSNEGYRKFVSASDVIDKELQSLMNEFLESNKISMNVMDSFANIKGLLLEIFI